ncbi:hypothetical protein D9M68_665220 [compost metagenome]
MQHGIVANGHAFADIQRKPHVGMHHRAVLHVALLADMNQLVVAAQYGVEPNARPRLQLDLADQRGVWRDPTFRVGIDLGLPQAVFHSISSFLKA